MNTSGTDLKPFEMWAIVEVIGHKRYVGYVTEQAIGGTSMVRIDVPDNEDVPAFTKFIGVSSIYAITPCTEETAMAFRKQLCVQAFSLYEAPRLPAIARAEYEED